MIKQTLGKYLGKAFNAEVTPNKIGENNRKTGVIEDYGLTIPRAVSGGDIEFACELYYAARGYETFKVGVTNVIGFRRGKESILLNINSPGYDLNPVSKEAESCGCRISVLDLPDNR